MREILFRGKRVDNSEWVEGFYVNVPEHYKPEMSGKSYIVSINNGLFMEVVPETVGEYTGFTGKNEKIFEGDIVRTSRYYYGNEIGVVRRGEYNVYSRYVFGGYYCVDKTSALIEWTSSWRCEVIGNIHDNPELLEE